MFSHVKWKGDCPGLNVTTMTVIDCQLLFDVVPWTWSAAGGILPFPLFDDVAAIYSIKLRRMGSGLKVSLVPLHPNLMDSVKDCCVFSLLFLVFGPLLGLPILVSGFHLGSLILSSVLVVGVLRLGILELLISKSYFLRLLTLMFISFSLML